MENTNTPSKPDLQVGRQGSKAVSSVKGLLTLFQWILIIIGAAVAVFGVIQYEILYGIIGVAVMALSIIIFAPLKALVIGFQAVVEAAEDAAAEKEQQYYIVDL